MRPELQCLVLQPHKTLGGSVFNSAKKKIKKEKVAGDVVWAHTSVLSFS